MFIDIQSFIFLRRSRNSRAIWVIQINFISTIYQHIHLRHSDGCFLFFQLGEQNSGKKLRYKNFLDEN